MLVASVAAWRREADGAAQSCQIANRAREIGPLIFDYLQALRTRWSAFNCAVCFLTKAWRSLSARVLRK